MQAVSTLARRLLGADAALDERLSLLTLEGPQFAAQALALLERTNGWAPVLDVLRRCVGERRPTLVYGDYDADGVTATLLLHRWLVAQGVPGNVFLPSRFKHGYGLSADVLAQAHEHGYKTLIALDCGTSNSAEVAQAQAAGLEVAIIDHHQARHGLPDCALLNSFLEDALPPLCSAGLVYWVLSALSQLGHGGLGAGDELELAGLATLADVVPLEPYNWYLAHGALQRIPETANLGMSELLKASGLHGLTRLTVSQATFQLAPRLNAPGRMHSARLALQLLSATDATQAREYARQIELQNEERKQQAEAITREALLQASEMGALAGVVLFAGHWHIGVLGLVAARVAEQLGKPAVILSEQPWEAEMLSGSVRGRGRSDVVSALARCGEVVASYGGHRRAAGLRIARGRLEEFRGAWDRALAEAADSAAPAEEPEALWPTVRLDELSEQFETDIWRLAPFGEGYPAPRCELSGVRVARVSYMGRAKTHLNLVVSDGVREARLAGFNQSHLMHRLKPGEALRPRVEIEPDNWNNRLSIMLRLVGLADSDAG